MQRPRLPPRLRTPKPFKHLQARRRKRLRRRRRMEQIAPTVLAYSWFHAKLVLNGADLAKLRAKRGLPPRTCAELGLRSSPRSNEKWLRQMPDLFPMNVLLDAGLWVRGDGPKDEPRPNPQYLRAAGVGPGKRKGPDGEDEELWDWTHPVLIPYLNKAGEVMDLRPHKRTQKWQHPRLYVPRRLAGISGEPWKEPAFAIITEGSSRRGDLPVAASARHHGRAAGDYADKLLGRAGGLAAR